MSRLFSHTPFVRFWLARLSGVTANQMLMVAVAWHMYDITSSASDLGLVGLFQFLPALLVPQELLQRAIALSSSGMQAAIICGPALGGVLYAHGAITVYLTCAALLRAAPAAGSLAMSLALTAAADSVRC